MKVSHYATQDVVSVTPESTIDRAIVLMEEFEIHHLPVLSHGRIVGIVSDRDILIAVGWKLSSQRRSPLQENSNVLGPQRVEQIMSGPVVTLSIDETAERAARLMIQRKINAIPLLAKGQLIGIITEADLLRHTHDAGVNGSAARAVGTLPVRDLMKARVTTVSPRASIIEVIDLMRRRRARHIPVTVDDSLLGIISDRDIRRALAEGMLADLESEQTGDTGSTIPTALDVMTRDVKTVSPDTSLSDAIAMMLNHTIHCLPVMQTGRLVGIFTHSDALAAVANAEML